MFSLRPEGQGIIYTGTYTGGPIPASAACRMASARLKHSDGAVLVRDIAQLHPGSYRGVIYGFEPGCQMTCGSLTLGQQVDFQEAQIFGCHLV